MDKYSTPSAQVQEQQPPVDGAKLLYNIEKTLRRFIGLPHEQDYPLLAVYALYSHAYNAFDHAPRLSIWSPTPGSGKSELLRVMSYLLPNGSVVANITQAGIFRLINKQHTLLMDEFDKMLGNGKLPGDIHMTLNAGWTRDATVPRFNKDTDEMEAFKPFGPVVIASKGKRLPDDLADRSLPVTMQMGDGGYEKLKTLIHKPELDTLREQAALWAKQNHEALLLAEPKLPAGFKNRAGDNWYPLYAVTDIADPSGKWHLSLDAVAVPFEKQKPQTDTGLLLLTDIYSSVGDSEKEFVSSKDLCDLLNEPEHWPWGSYRDGAGLDPRRLSGLLTPFSVKSEMRDTGRDATGKRIQARGYLIKHFDEHWQRYGIAKGPRVTRVTDVTDVLGLTREQLEERR
ncbi:Protein of unknown function [Phyllobacterium sp. CL33Tsu]|uniref:DUF3631 domain-containing protein n=1 Tax=Phyllobacterium sp. CL33Tsu TaxID=1798191 RepID=UPI0008EA150E|nr:DUF3631 domain-containing protein [Phyllobacterium sp. CL33Tsu]SFJ16517.1 Protein of unknown function [Phyllobacterium sp. CL33Tsu]